VHYTALLSYYVRSTFKAGQGSDLYSQITSDMANFELVFLSRELVRVLTSSQFAG